jgi:hypothetical protein
MNFEFKTSKSIMGLLKGRAQEIHIHYLGFERAKAVKPIIYKF